MSDRYAVFGHPVGHSLSPRIHSLFARQTGQDLLYDAIDPGADGFVAAARHFLARGGVGFNVTVPFKAAAFDLADSHDELASQAGAVNTVRREPDGTLRGFNTDGIGLVRDITTNLGHRLTGKRLLVIGAGGAAAGIIGPLAAQHPETLFIANRTADKARALADHFQRAGLPQPAAVALDGIDANFDVVINATSAGLSGASLHLDPAILAPGCLAYDLVYSDRPTLFLQWALTAGAAMARDGLGMLVEQAAEAFLIWRGVRPDTGPVIRSLRPP